MKGGVGFWDLPVFDCITHALVGTSAAAKAMSRSTFLLSEFSQLMSAVTNAGF